MNKKYILTLFLIFFLMPMCLSASEIKPVFVPVESNVTAGQSFYFSIYFKNNNKTKESVELKNEIECFVKTASELKSLPASSIQNIDDHKKILHPKQGTILNYRVKIPADISGKAKIFFPAYKTIEPYRFNIEAKEVEHKSYQTIDSMLSIYQPYSKNLSPYKPVYFLVATDPEDSKFQLSFKYKFINDNEFSIIKNDKLKKYLKGFYLGYTQTSFWDLESDSIPFEDTSYKPEIFHLTSNLLDPDNQQMKFFLQTGFQHESNGRGEDDSRSTNFLYIKPIFVYLPQNSAYGFSISPKFWLYVNNEKETNKDLKKYRGYFQLDTSIGRADDFLIDSKLYWGEKGGSISVDLFYPMHRFINKLDLYFQIQYTNALAESLLNYKDRNESLRLGFAIMR